MGEPPQIEIDLTQVEFPPLQTKNQNGEHIKAGSPDDNESNDNQQSTLDDDTIQTKFDEAFKQSEKKWAARFDALKAEFDNELAKVNNKMKHAMATLVQKEAHEEMAADVKTLLALVLKQQPTTDTTIRDVMHPTNLDTLAHDAETPPRHVAKRQNRQDTPPIKSKFTATAAVLTAPTSRPTSPQPMEAEEGEAK